MVLVEVQKNEESRSCAIQVLTVVGKVKKLIMLGQFSIASRALCSFYWFVFESTFWLHDSYVVVHSNDCSDWKCRSSQNRSGHAYSAREQKKSPVKHVNRNGNSPGSNKRESRKKDQERVGYVYGLNCLLNFSIPYVLNLMNWLIVSGIFWQ